MKMTIIDLQFRLLPLDMYMHQWRWINGMSCLRCRCIALGMKYKTNLMCLYILWGCTVANHNIVYFKEVCNLIKTDQLMEKQADNYSLIQLDK